MNEEGGGSGRSARRIGDAYLIATVLPLSVLIGYGMGWLLDWFLGTRPWCTYVCSGLGVIAGFREAIRTALRVGREEDQAARGDQGGR